MSRLHRSVYFDLCCYIWDYARPVPAAEMPVMLGDLPGWERYVEELVASGKLVRAADGSIVNLRALAEAEKARDLHRKKSEGGRTGALKTNERRGSVVGSGDGIQGGSGDGIQGGSGDAEPEPEPEPEDISPNPFSGESWDGWIAMRTKAKKPPTERAIKLAIGKLTKLKADGHDPDAVLDQSTMNGWTGLFAVKQERNGHGNGSRPSGWVA